MPATARDPAHGLTRFAEEAPCSVSDQQTGSAPFCWVVGAIVGQGSGGWLEENLLVGSLCFCYMKGEDRQAVGIEFTSLAPGHGEAYLMQIKLIWCYDVLVNCAVFVHSLLLSSDLMQAQGWRRSPSVRWKCLTSSKERKLSRNHSASSGTRTAGRQRQWW